MNRKWFSLLALCLVSTPVLAHPGHADGGLLAAFLHPFTGVDHLLAMLFVGVWAGQIGGGARWQIPLAFLAAMSAGWAAGAAGLRMPGVESGIAASLLALGLLIALRLNLPRILQLGATALFALFHGVAHGLELPATTPLATTFGFLAATALLHALGLVIAAWLPAHNQRIYQTAGAGLALVGGGLLLI